MARGAKKRRPQHPGCDQVFRCEYWFGGGRENGVLHITSTRDFLVHTLANSSNDELTAVSFGTPTSQFRRVGWKGAGDGIGLYVPAGAAMTLGCIGAQAGETINIAANGNVTLMLTVVTGWNAQVTVTETIL